MKKLFSQFEPKHLHPYLDCSVFPSLPEYPFQQSWTFLKVLKHKQIIIFCPMVFSAMGEFVHAENMFVIQPQHVVNSSDNMKRVQ